MKVVSIHGCPAEGGEYGLKWGVYKAHALLYKAFPQAGSSH